MSFFARVASRITYDLLSARKAVILLLVIGFGVAGITGGAHAQALATAGSTFLDWGMGFLGLAFSAIAWGIGKLIIIVIGMVIIPILGYNGFGTSNVVSIGWALVRDVTNMFVIVVLLLMALQTMFGVGRIDWRQQLPKFFLAVVAMNFSKTITLFVIDIGQVVMFTFVNALQDIAAGNFINLFQVSAFWDLASAPAFQQALQDNGGYNAVGYLATSWLTASLLGMVLVVMLMLAFVFIYRIVLLWVLIIVSPIAFFAGGVGNTLSSVGGQYADWWRRLAGATALGPILTFFLWLALAAASNGAIATSENFNTTATADAQAQATGPYTAIFETDKLLSLFIALVLITVGFQAASAQAAAIGGPVASLISEGTGNRLLKGALAAPPAALYGGGRLAGRGGGRALRQYGAQLERKGSAYAPSAISAQVGRVGAELQERGGALGSIVAPTLFSAEKAGSAFKATIKKQDEDAVASYSDAQYYAAARRWAEGEKPPAGMEGQHATIGVKLATDKDFQKKMTDMLGKEYSGAELTKMKNQMIGSALSSTEANKGDLIGDDDKKKAGLFKSRSANLNLLPEGPDRQQKIAAHIADEDFKLSQLSPAAVQDKDVMNALKNKVVADYIDKDTGKKVEIMAWDYLKQGRQGTAADVREAVTKIDRQDRSDWNKAKAQDITDQLGQGGMNLSGLQPSNFTDRVNGNTDNVMQGLVDYGAKGGNLSSMPPSSLTEFVNEAQNQRTTASAADQARIDRALFSAERNPARLGVNTNGTINPGNRNNVAEQIKLDPTTIRDLAGAINGSGGSSNDVTRVVLENTSKDSIDKLVTNYASRTSDQQGNALRESAEAIVRALDAEKRAAVANNNKKEENRIQVLIDRGNLAIREMPKLP